MGTAIHDPECAMLSDRCFLGGPGANATLPARPADRAAECFTLRDNDLWVVRPRSGGRSHITCIVGQLWVTAEGVADDVALGPGESWIVRGAGKIVVQALTRVAVGEERESV